MSVSVSFLNRPSHFFVYVSCDYRALVVLLCALSVTGLLLARNAREREGRSLACNLRWLEQKNAFLAFARVRTVNVFLMPSLSRVSALFNDGRLLKLSLGLGLV